MVAIRSLCAALLLFGGVPVSAAAGSAVATLQAIDARVADIAFRLQTANSALCEPVMIPGFAVHALVQYAPADRPRVAAETGLGPLPAVLAVVPGSSAARAGLRRGDAIMAINGAPVPVARAAHADYGPVEALRAQIESALRRPPMDLTVMREGRRVELAIAGDLGCPSRVEVMTGSGLDALADGRYVQLSEKLVAFANDDDQLAFAIAHELAHNVLKHRVRLDSEHVSRGLFAGVGKNGAALRATEVEADRLAVWLVARAGYDPAAGPAFLARMGKTTGLGILSDGTHPRWKERVARVQASVAEVAAQRAAGKPLVPPSQSVGQQSPSHDGIRR